MNKICTNIEQSKKLIELGIDVNTADMFYAEISIDGNIKHNLHLLESYGFKTFSDTKLKESKHLGFIPAWSLSSLLELIHNNYMLRNSNVGTNRYNVWIAQRKSLVWTETPLDAAFEMVCWLLENKKI